MKTPSLPLIALGLGLGIGLAGCAVTDPRVTDRAPGALPPHAAPERLTDEAIRADHRAISALRQRLAGLNQNGRVPTGNPHWAKAQCWLDMAQQNYHENDRSRVIEEALAESKALVDALEQGKPPADRTPAVGNSVRLREDLWTRAARVKSTPAAACVVAQAACLEVQLVWSGHEYAEGGWRHANPYIGIAEQQADAMDRGAAACAAPAPAAAAVAPVVREVVIERLVLTTDALFDFDRASVSDIRAAGRARLDLLAERAKGLRGIERIVLVGHTDRLGSAQHNQPLSLQRATAVRDHLVARGLPPALFVVEGKGSEQPVKRCEDKQPRSQLIACLQDNRRVEVEIRGRVAAATP
ncbi:MAG: OmpA family protein [Hydrogenophaga sp.]|uniref:OmpA family protein n=1 Tax=Hydrogenophaga sp. TaxID=1904254 RepID=UPI0026345F86|nr:OmpA family protein [Hydrogenophaga sp.]MDM7941396.1 OmpA family protein [Hydrogenophaga sp.]